jgi:hypothetical protein
MRVAWAGVPVADEQIPVAYADPNTVGDPESSMSARNTMLAPAAIVG